jgi:hypothetical protein
MSPKAMGEFVVRVANAFGLKQPHVVGPDIGTGASLFATGFGASSSARVAQRSRSNSAGCSRNG